ncbi:acetyl-CoA carboxylase biotin carboxylase subunit family protein [Streptomyces sp. NPDC059787]|uniref:ATP-grasp domain-containing protein n=1 Tax=Streptomyces sp. NPDC059787 TaxID=3346947 RepID=UPI00364889D9
MGSAGITDIVTALEEFAVPVFVCPESEHEEPATDLMTEFGVLCDIRGMEFTDAVEHLRRLNPDGIVTFSDYQLDLTSRLAAELGLPFHSPAVVRALTRKSVQRQLLNDHGASAVATELVTGRLSLLDAFARIGGPAVLKPDTGTGSRSTYRILDAHDAERAAADVFPDDGCAPSEPFVLEAEIAASPAEGPWGDYVSVDSAVFHDRIEHVAVLGKFPLAKPFRETGSFFPADVPPDTAAAVTSLVSRAVRALGVRHGICHTEVKLSPDGPQAIEVNGRLGGRVNELVQKAGGPSLVRIAVQLALGGPDTPRLVDAWDPGRVTFLYAKPPPAGAKRLCAVRGVERLRDRAEISLVTAEYEEGATLDWRLGRLANVYVCYGGVDTHAQLARLVPEIDRTVSLSFEY